MAITSEVASAANAAPATKTIPTVIKKVIKVLRIKTSIECIKVAKTIFPESVSFLKCAFQVQHGKHKENKRLNNISQDKQEIHGHS